MKRFAAASRFGRGAGTCLLLVMLSGFSGLSGEGLLPLEMPQKSIPVNGDEIVNDPEGVSTQFGLCTEAGSKIVEHGDSIALLKDFSALETPCVKWAAPYAQEPVRALLFVSPTASVRNAVELRQRSSFEYTVVQIPGVLGEKLRDANDYFGRRIMEKVDGSYDVIVLPVCFAGSVDGLLEKIMEKVEGGCGLVLLLSPGQWWRIDKRILEKLKELSPLQHGNGGVAGTPKRAQAGTPLTEAHSMLSWPSISMHKGVSLGKDANALFAVEGTPFAATGTYGKGRVFAIYLGGGANASLSLLPSFDPEKECRSDNWHEAVYAFYLKAIAWAAGREPTVSMSLPEILECKAGEKPSVPIALKDTAGKSRSLKLAWHLQDSWGFPAGEGTEDVTVSGKELVKELILPACAVNGLHRLDIRLYDGGKVENWGNAAIRVDGGVKMLVEPMQEAGAVVGAAKYKVSAGSAAGALSVRAVDDMDRIFFESSSELKDGGIVVVELRRSCTPRNRIEFTLAEGKNAVARHVAILNIPRIGLGALDGDFAVASYGMTPADPHLERYMGMLYREAGINSYYGNWHSREYIRERAADLGLYIFTGPGPEWVYMKQASLDKILKCCPNSQEVREKWKKNVEISIGDQRIYGGIGRVLDDEAFMAFTSYKDGEMRGAQACQCDTCMKLFREKMREVYGEVAKLNCAWETDFKSFDEVRAVEEDEVKGKDNPSGWLEFRQYMNWIYATQYYGWIQELHKPLAQDYGVGPGAPHNTTREGGPTYRGGDYSSMKDAIRFMMAYGGPESRLYRDAYVGQPGGQKYDPPAEWSRHGSWYHLLNGADCLWYYLGPAIIGNELAWRKQGQWTYEGVRDIRDGIGELVRASEPLDRQVRILYSSENMAMAWLLAKRKDSWNAFALKDGMPLSQKTFESLFDEFLFIQPSMVTAGQIQQGDLKDCKLLVLPQAFNMDNATAEAVRKFVDGGGCVVADVMPAVREIYGKPRVKSPLEDVFGVDASKAELHRESEAWYSVGVGYKAGGGAVEDKDYFFGSDRSWLPADVSFLGVKPTAAKAQGVVLSKEGKEAEAVFVNQFGKGKAVLLNFLYRDLNSETCGWHLIFGRALCQLAGVKAPAQIVKPVTLAPLSYRPLRAMQNGKATLLGSIRGRLIWSGNRPVLIDPSRALDMSDKAVFTWEKPCYAYDVRARKFLGHGTNAEIDLPSFEGRLIALLPYKVENVRIEAPASAKAGSIVEVKASVTASDGEKPGKHVLRLEVTSPTGYVNLIYCKTRTATDGEAKFEIPFADNDRKGDWKITVRDVMTGTEGTSTLRIE